MRLSFDLDGAEDDYEQCFCVIGSKGHFKGAHFNHLPPLELPQDPELTLEELDIRIQTLEYRDAFPQSPLTPADILGLRGELKHIHESLHKLEQGKTKTGSKFAGGI